MFGNFLSLFFRGLFALTIVLGVPNYSYGRTALSKCHKSVRGTGVEVFERDARGIEKALYGEPQLSEVVNQFKADGRPVLIITDSWDGQKSGVVTVMKILKSKIEKLTDGKVEVVMMSPDQFKGFVIKSEQELMVSYLPKGSFMKKIRELNPQAVHIAVEGPLGLQAKRLLKKMNIPFTSAFHSKLAEFVALSVQTKLELVFGKRIAAKAYQPVVNVVNWYLKKFHSGSQGVMAPTESLADYLLNEGYQTEQIRQWSHGVDIDHFRPELRDEEVFKGLQRPISFYAGRIAPEKNLEDFLSMNVPGTKVLVGDGPSMAALKAKYPDAVFMGRKNYEDLPKYFASSDVFVFTSLTDTFGLVQLESLATGTPVIGFDVTGPVDVITSEKVGVLAHYDANQPAENVARLEVAWKKSLSLNREDARAFAVERPWEKSIYEFMAFLYRTANLNP